MTSSTDFLFAMNPHLADVRGMKSFLNNRLHIQFERMDNSNDTDGFEKMFQQYPDAMVEHRNMSWGCFSWDNFDEWITKRTMYFIHDNKIQKTI
jgi:hypothetical protein